MFHKVAPLVIIWFRKVVPLVITWIALDLTLCFILRLFIWDAPFWELALFFAIFAVIPLGVIAGVYVVSGVLFGIPLLLMKLWEIASVRKLIHRIWMIIVVVFWLIVGAYALRACVQWLVFS